MALLRGVPSRARALAPRPARVGSEPSPRALLLYGALAILTLGVSLARDASPLATEPWVDLPAWSRDLASVLGGAALAVGTILATRAFVRRWSWAKDLHADLRPAVRNAKNSTILVLGLASAASEELLFRGLLAPVLGLALSSLAFGAIHQLRGRTGWIWAGWAFVMGLLFGALFFATGSLVGPIVAHAAINVANLRFLRDTDVEPTKSRHLGGLLGPV